VTHLTDAGAPALSAAQARVIAAAQKLFARHGVGGTSLQMIADELGVTKAAVYHQYRTRDEIVLAAARSELDILAMVVDTAEDEPSPKRTRDALVDGVVDLAVDRRRTVGTILGDPVIAGVFDDDEQFRAVMHRMRHILIGDEAGAEARVRLAMLLAAISGAATHPFVRDLDDDALRAQLSALARRFLGLRG
jgi:AcrR family transcriptional regulator